MEEKMFLNIEVIGEMGKSENDPAKTLARLNRIKLAVFFGFIALTAIFAANLLSPKVNGTTVDPQTDISGAELFANNCARCHGADGTGGKGPDLTSEKRQAKWKDSDEKLVKKITNGGFIMPSFRKKLKADEIQAIADHVRTLKE